LVFLVKKYIIWQPCHSGSSLQLPHVDLSTPYSSGKSLTAKSYAMNFRGKQIFRGKKFQKLTPGVDVTILKIFPPKIWR
jgi:hypothetical protein